MHHDHDLALKLTAAHGELADAGGNLALLIKTLNPADPNDPTPPPSAKQLQDHLKEIIKTAAEAGKILAVTYPQIKS